MDANSNELVFNRKTRVKIEPLSVKILTVLTLKNGIVATRSELIERVWDGNEGVGNTALTKNIYKLRKIFQEHLKEDIIETIPTRGYRIQQRKFLSYPSLSTSLLVKLGVAASILTFIILKLTNPGMFHMLSHRMTH